MNDPTREGITSIEDVEKDVDRAFASNALKSRGYAQSVWTLLSQTEDAYLKILHMHSDVSEVDIFTDIRLNSLTYPLRVCYRDSPTSRKLLRELVDADYQLAVDWFGVADHGYYNFSSIFPLWHRGKLKITANGDALQIEAPTSEKAYEAYNRLFQKDARPYRKQPLPYERLTGAVMSRTSYGRDWYRVNFEPHLVSQLVSSLTPFVRGRHSLPEEWAFAGFTLGEYRKAISTVQALLWGWMIARNMLVESLVGLGYRSAVWVVSKEELCNRVRRYTRLEGQTIGRIFELLTFGAMGIRNPDVAVQPLMDLRNGYLALSPFVWLNTNAERNLCVLVNQIPRQRYIYDRLKNEKEAILRREMKEFLGALDLDVRSGQVDGTDLDVAVVDREDRVCLCLELKWFIEPAEVREIDERTKELKSGVAQALLIRSLYERKDKHLVRDVLGIEGDFDFMVAVASRNWIGYSDAQHPDIPIVKVWHLLYVIKDRGLRSAVNWLKGRDYMPRKGKDFEVVPVEVKCGRWVTEWYGIKPLGPHESRRRDGGTVIETKTSKSSCD